MCNDYKSIREARREEERNLHLPHEPLDSFTLLIWVSGEENVVWVVVFGKVQENSTRLKDVKVSARVISDGWDSAVGVDSIFETFELRKSRKRVE
jgi:hypothetical protein